MPAVRHLVLAMTAAAASTLGACSTIPPSSFMSASGARPAPIGYLSFCRSHSAECVAPAASEEPHEAASEFWRAAFSPPQPVISPASQTVAPDLSPTLWSELGAINREVNTEVRTYRHHQEWDLPSQDANGLSGDCKDIALEKRRRLMAAGFPGAALSMAVVRTRSGQSHAVLVATTNGGDYVLDSLSPWVSPWRSLSYRWVERQGGDDPSLWLVLAQASKTLPGA